MSLFDGKPIITKRRKGTIDNSFVSLSEAHQIVNGKVVLSEIPNEFKKVTVTGLSVTWYEKASGTPTENEYVVDYNSNTVTFHPSRNGQQLQFDFEGTGLHYIPANMIYTQENNGEVTQTLQELTDATEQARSTAETTNTNVAQAESLRVTAENTRVSQENTRKSQETSRVNAESSRVTAENSRASAESARATSENTRVSNESTRQSQESARQSNESARGSTESNRVTAENTRVTNENNRKTNETGRVNAESSRVAAEDVRETNESTREINEADRIAEEELRETAENNRASAETTRQTNESGRVSAESARVTAENNRVSTENARAIAESGRVSAENTRVDSENTRSSNETTRQNQEVTRQSQETTRQTQESTRQTNTTNAINNLNNTVSNINNSMYTNPKGIKTTYASLPSSGNVVGDTWHVTSDSDTTKNGHWRWSGSAWVQWYQFNPSGVPNIASLNDVDKAKADFVRNQMHSGVEQLSSLTTGSTSTLNGFTVKAFKAVINGYEVAVPDTTITLDAPPETGTRDDLVFLEAYFPASGNGYTLSYRIRTVSNVNFIGYPEGVNDTTNVKAWGGQSVNTTLTYSQDSIDKGLYKAGTGSSADKTSLLSYDGYSYGICLFRVKRRNSSGFSPSNPNGARNYQTVSFPLTTIISPGYTTSKTLSAGDYAYVQVGDVYKYDSSGQFVYKIISKDGNNNVTVQSIGTANVNALSNGILDKAVDHNPQSLYSNVIHANDITDLRHRTQIQYNYDYELKRASDMFMRGEIGSQKKMLKTYHGIPKSQTDINTVFYASLDGSVDAEIGGSPTSTSGSISYMPMPTGSGLRGYSAKYNLTNADCGLLTVDFILQSNKFISKSTIMGINSSTTFLYNIQTDGNSIFYGSNSATINQNKPNHIRFVFNKAVRQCYVNGQLKINISATDQTGVQTADITINSSALSDIIVSDVMVSNIDRGSLFPQLPPDFISGDAIIMPSFTNQRRILSEAQSTQTVNGIAKVGTTGSSRGLATSRASGSWASGDTITVQGMAGELISGVFDADSALCRIISFADGKTSNTTTSNTKQIKVDDVSKLSVNDTLMPFNLLSGANGTLQTVTAIDTNNKLITVDIGFAYSDVTAWGLFETTSTSSVPQVYFMNGTNKTAVSCTWTGLGTNQATCTLGTNASLTNQDLQIDYSLIMPSGQPALIAPTTTTLMGEAGIRVTSSTITSDFSNKVSGRTWENPNVMKYAKTSTLLSPSSGSWAETISSGYANLGTLDGVVGATNATVSGQYAQQLFSFNLIEAIERQLKSKIPASTIAGKVSWIRKNTIGIKFYWNGFGSCPTGNYAEFRFWNGSTWWDTNKKHTKSTVTEMTMYTTNLDDYIRPDGFVYVNCFSNPSDGVTPSVINTDYAKFELYLVNKILNSYRLVTGSSVAVRDDFAGKVRDDFSNPNVARFTHSSGGLVIGSLVSPNDVTINGFYNEFNNYNLFSLLDADLSQVSCMNSGKSAGVAYKFNLISIVESKYGLIPSVDKVQWLKDNIATNGISLNWWGYGSSPTGNKATVKVWYVPSVSKWSEDAWTGQTKNHTNSAVTKLTSLADGNYIDSNGFVHFLAYAESSDGNVESTIYTDYCNIELTFKNSLTGYDMLLPENPRRDGGQSNVLFIDKNTKTVTSMFPVTYDLGLVTYSEYLPSTEVVASTTDITILAECDDLILSDLSSAVGSKIGSVHPWGNIAYKVNNDNLNLYGELGYSLVKFSPESKGLNIGSKIQVSSVGFANNYWKQYALNTISKPMVGIARYLVLHNGEIKLFVFGKYSTNGSFITDNSGVGMLLSLQGKPLSKTEEGIVRSGVNTPTNVWKSSELEPMGYVDHTTRKLITTNNSI